MITRRILGSIAALSMACPAIAEQAAPTAGSASKDLGSNVTPEQLRATCGKKNILPELAGHRPRHVTQRIPYPTTASTTANSFGSRRVNAERALDHLPPDILAPLKGLGGALMKSNNIDPALRELVIVRVGYLSKSIYEVRQHASFAMSLGVPRDKIAGMACRSPKGLSAVEDVTIKFVDEVVRSVSPSDATLAAARRHFNDSQILQLVTITGEWMMAGRLIETIGVPPDDFVVGDQGVPANFAPPQGD